MQPRTFMIKLVSVWLLALVFHSAQAEPDIFLPKGSFKYAVSPYIALYEDASRQLTIEDIVKNKYQLFFSPNHAESLKLGVSDSNFWLRFSVHNPFDEQREVVFSLSNSAFDLVEFYRLHADNSYEQFSPEDVNRNIRGGMLHFHTLRLRFEPKSTNTYLVKLHSTGLVTSHAMLMTRNQFIAGEQRYFLALGVSLGFSLMAIIGFLYIGMRFNLAVGKFSAAFCAVTIVYLLANLCVFRLFFGMDGPTSDKTAQLSLAALSMFHVLAASGLVAQRRHRLNINRFVYALGLISVPVGLILVFFVSRAALPSIAFSYVVASFVMGLFLALIDTRTSISQFALVGSYFFASISIALTLMTSYNLLPVSAISAWGEIIIPMGIAVCLMVAAIYQMPSYQQAQQPKPLEGIEGDVLVRLGLDMLAPANNLIAVNELFMDAYTGAPQQEFCQNNLQLSQELQHQALLISDLGLLQQGNFELLNDSHELQAMLNEVLQRVQPQATRKQIEIILNVDLGVPAYLWIDKIRFKVVLYEALSAALSLSAPGEMAIQIQPLTQASGVGLRIQLQLSHLMVRPEQVRKHFAVMQPQDELSARPPSQYWSCYLAGLLLTQMQASVEVESMTVQGACISLVFADVPAGTPVFLQQSMSQTQNLVGRSVLVVDDSATLRTIITRQTKRWGMRSFSTYSGKEALAMLRNQSTIGKNIEVLIVDQDLPLMNGITLAQRIAQDDNIVIKPKVIMLASLKPELMQEAEEASAIDILLTKPINHEHLLLSLLELTS